MKTIHLFLLMIWMGSSAVLGDELIVRHVPPESEGDRRNEYYTALLRLGLEKTLKTDGPFRLEMSNVRMTQSRAIQEVKRKRGIDVMWTMTSQERESELLPIRIPLLKGLLGYRIFIIRQGEEAKFAAIQTLEQLKQKIAGQGADWPDTKILRANGIDVVGAINYEGLFKMLKSKRFDYFPRGVNEPWTEVKSHPEQNLVIEATLLLQYPAPIYFFVDPSNPLLAKRLEKGLRLAISDGSFEHLFRHHPINQETFELANLEKRKMFRLKNPLLTPETPLDEKELWYDPQGSSSK